MPPVELLTTLENLAPEPERASTRANRSSRHRAVGPVALPDDLAVQLTLARRLPRASSSAGRHAERFPFGIPSLDALLDGGLARGRLIELRGRPSTGRFSCVLSLLAAATSAGETVALVDLGHELDPQRAATAGVATERLLWARPDDVKSALSAAEILLSGTFPLVVLDLGLPPLPGGRGPDAAWRRLARAARHHRGTLLVSAPYRVSGTAAGDVLRARATRAAWHGAGRAPRLLLGASTVVELEKTRGGGRGSATTVWTNGGLVAPLAARLETASESRRALGHS